MEAAQLARELTRRMNDVVPSGIGVRVEGDMLRFDSTSHAGRAGSYACRWLDEGVGEAVHVLARACWLALSDLQDFVAEATTEAWPGSRTMPRPGTRVEGDMVLLWYGESEDPVLWLEPLPVVL